MVWIHGGAFVCGSSRTDVYGPEFLMSQDIVLVTINYRVGLLGFLSFKDSSVDVPGNAGLKDQVVALQWVKKFIHQFNGDSNNITLFGQDAGAASVHLHMLSPLSTGLFQKVIMQSGCALNPWVNGLRGNGRLVGKVLNIQGTDANIFEKLKVLDVKEIFRAQEELANDNRVDVLWLCSPIVERKHLSGSFLTDEPINLIKVGKYAKVPTIIGYTSREAYFKSIIPNNLKCKKGSLLSYTIADKVEQFYYGPRMQRTRMGRYPRFRRMDPLYQLITDVFFLKGIFMTVKHHLEMAAKVPLYYYKFCYENTLSTFKQATRPLHRRKYPGAVHGDDLGYFFDSYLTPDIYFEDENDIAIQNIGQLWTSFARTGQPTISCDNKITLKWKPTTKDSFHCLLIGPDIKKEYNPDMDRMLFWKKIYENDKRTKDL
ncbi:hypothetical protein FQR65_LT09439 [Abscondita terminalis]|nr:hypothetical protein FQR65_LT09439 [Abscondita terminalis]